MTNPDQSGLLGRRAFLGAAGLIAAAPILTEADLARAAQAPAAPTGMALHGQAPGLPPADAVLINANENPLGPSKAACEAIAQMGPIGGRYDLRGETAMLAAAFAEQSGLPKDHIAVYAGSSEPLHYSVLAYASPTRSFVSADPSYEAGRAAAYAKGAKIHLVPLKADYSHDVKAMLAADPDAGVIYICNPNNPTGTITSKADILWALENKPAGALLMIDEAYIHLSDAEPCLDLVKAGKDVVVLRTFSKIYGMAGIRCGFAVARPDILAKLMAYGMNPMPITGSAAARASLTDPDLVPTRKKLIADTRNETLAWLKANGFKVLGDPQTNCFMIDTGRNGIAVASAMRERKVYIGRSWPIWPNAVRVSVGTPEEMMKFRIAFKDVMGSAAPLALNGPPAHEGFVHLS